MLQPLSSQQQNFSGPNLGSRTQSEAVDEVTSEVVPVAPQSDQGAPVENSGSGFVTNKTDKPLPAGKNKPSDTIQLSEEAREIARLAERDRDVRTHEAAHAAVGGPYAGSPSLTYKSGPDGRFYAVGGEVSIDISPVAGDPQATIEKAQTVRAAALAPAQPSAQDMRVAARAMQMAAQAYAELSAQSNDPSASARPGINSPPPQSDVPATESDSSGAWAPEPLTPSAPTPQAPASLSIRW
jgi:hypothetical protein